MKIKNMFAVFAYCHQLKTLRDISNWNTSNVIDMRVMFCECISLVSLPDISKWDTKNV